MILLHFCILSGNTKNGLIRLGGNNEKSKIVFEGRMRDLWGMCWFWSTHASATRKNLNILSGLMLKRL